MKRSMTCAEFDEILYNDGAYDEIHSEMYWEGNFSSNRVFKFFKAEAERRQVTLTDVEEWSYDEVFHNNYESDDDKGLS